MIYFNIFQMAEIMNDITSTLCWEEILNRWSAVQSQRCPDLGNRRINEKKNLPHGAAELHTVVSMHAKPQGPTWYPKCALMFHSTLALTMYADYKYQFLSLSHTSAIPQHSTVKTPNSSLFQHKAHAAKTTETELFVTRQGANSVS